MIFEFKTKPIGTLTHIIFPLLYSFIYSFIYICTEYQQGVGILLDTEDADANMVACPNLNGEWG